jgi:hypothetical protein
VARVQELENTILQYQTTQKNNESHWRKKEKDWNKERRAMTRAQSDR